MTTAQKNTKVLACKCKHEYQDSKFGKGMRAHNWATKIFNGKGGWRCTVCLNEKQETA
jgi:hypothetical protein